jgi:hypothetical protein
MITFKQKKLIILIVLALSGMTYFSFLSNWEINLWLKNYLAILPLQVLAFLYVFLYWNGRKVKIR